MYITLTRKKIFLMLCVFIILLIVLAQFFSAKAQRIEISTNAKRVEYIESLGIKLLSDDYGLKKVIIPEEFSDVYKKYNELQREANFDLSEFRGKEVTIYTYSCGDSRIVNLIVYKDRLIGGDIAETLLGGSMTALKGEA